ncbi:unnamed protein product [Acanthosepion pharaonis]|uniref:Uncharacterized protein n=1 Tax=Acanthosepion pharaonis TaxID=158019 RepID=A0A812E364_ACAPH|nr:unnamed protein product [Sepia pharaonis]
MCVSFSQQVVASFHIVHVGADAYILKDNYIHRRLAIYLSIYLSICRFYRVPKPLDILNPFSSSLLICASFSQQVVAPFRIVHVGEKANAYILKDKCIHRRLALSLSPHLLSLSPHLLSLSPPSPLSPLPTFSLPTFSLSLPLSPPSLSLSPTFSSLPPSLSLSPHLLSLSPPSLSPHLLSLSPTFSLSLSPHLLSPHLLSLSPPPPSLSPLSPPLLSPSLSPPLLSPSPPSLSLSPPLSLSFSPHLLSLSLSLCRFHRVPKPLGVFMATICRLN